MFVEVDWWHPENDEDHQLAAVVCRWCGQGLGGLHLVDGLFEHANRGVCAAVLEGSQR